MSTSIPVQRRSTASRLILSALCAGLALAALVPTAAATAPTGYQQTNLISNGAVDAAFVDKNFVDPWGISIGSDFWINANVTGLNYIAGPSGSIAFTVTIPPASGSGPGSPTGTIFTGAVPTGSFLLPDKSAPFFLFCTLDGTISGWAGGNVLIAVNNSKSNAVYNDMALLTNTTGTYLVLANFGAGADVEVYDKDYKRAMTGAFKDPNVPATYAPYAVHVIGDTVYVTYTPRTVPGYQEILGAGHGFVDAFSKNGVFQSRIIPTGGKLDAPWGMALAPAGFGEFAGDLLVGSFGDGTISAYDPKTWAFKGQVSDESGNLIANPGLWEIVFGQTKPAVGDPNTLYFTAGLNHETAGLFGAITVATAGSTATKTTLSSDANPATQGTKVTFTALVAPSTGTGEPEGKVAFVVDGKPLATASVDSTAHATASTSSLTVGKHTVTASYSGDANFGKSAGTLSETIKLPAAATPKFSPAAGAYSSAQSITISDTTAKAVIYYTLDGTTPTTKSTVFTKAFTLSKTTTVKAIAAATGLANSAVSSATYTITIGATSAPTLSPNGGSFTSTQSVKLADSDKSAVIYYTLDGSVPTTKSAVYSGPISVAKTTTIWAIAAAPGLTPSSPVWATFTITAASPTAAPKFTPAAGTYSATQSVTLADSTPYAVIHYTTDGSTPTMSSPVYSGAISVSYTTTIKAMAEAPGWGPSTVASGVYTISGGGW